VYKSIGTRTQVAATVSP